MGTVAYLPVQHPQRPHCTICNAELPSFNGVTIFVAPGDLKEATLRSVTYNIICKCGAEWCVTKKIKK